MKRPKILLVEDDLDVRESTQVGLERDGFIVLAAADGIAGYDQALRHRPAAAVIDVAMPGLDGLQLTRALVEQRICPVLLLTARDQPGDQIAGFAHGADDYVTKPFHRRILTARINAVLRRTGAQTALPQQIADVAIDLDAMTATVKGRAVALTATEHRLLSALLAERGTVIAPWRLLELAWPDEDLDDTHVLTVNISRIRAKLGPGVITTVHGAGYRIDRP